MKKTSNLLYGDIVNILLEKIFKGLEVCNNKYNKNKKDISILDEDVQNVFLPLKDLPPFKGFINNGINKHITEGLPDKHRKRENKYPRISMLTIQAFLESKETEKTRNFTGVVLPSPLLILKRLLTIPEEVQTEAYALYSCRYLLNSFINIVPFEKDIDSVFFKDVYRINDEEIRDSVSSFNKNINIQARWPKWNSDYPKKITNGDRVNCFIGHFLSLKGFSVLWFKNGSDLNNFLANVNSSNLKDKFLKFRHHFRQSIIYIKLPNESEIINLITAIPIPINGFDVIFQGGLKRSSNSSLVISINGKAGVGKTSVALSLASSLAPFNTKCLYLTLEEGKEDLNNRLFSLTPEYIKKLSIYKKSDAEGNFLWFTPIEIKEDQDLNSFSKNILDSWKKSNITSIIPKPENKNISFYAPSICPALVVIDNLNELLIQRSEESEKDFNSNLENFIRKCRKLKALVVLISGENMPQKSLMDYLVDVSINLEHHGTEKIDEKPFRLFHLTKTRHQISRNGSHLFHISGSKGFRISPQVSSQIDKREVLKKPVVDDNEVINILNLTKNKNLSEIKYRNTLDIFPNSQILIHGNGSGGKAGFALKVLLTPPLKKEILKDCNNNKNYLEFVHSNNIVFNDLELRRKILILSFLYPEKYYEELVFKPIYISKTIEKCYPGILKPIVNTKYFFPGFLSPEDIVNKVTKLLDQALLDGEPYTGILLDGMHNVFLQFKKLQERDMIWPLLYSILTRYDLTVVTTFTNFSLDSKLIEYSSGRSSSPDQIYMQKGQAPFLHALVKATDFYIIVEEKTVEIENRTENRYLIMPKMAIKQEISPNTYLVWDKHRAIIMEFTGKIANYNLTENE